MPVQIALLRGINVGKAKRLPMAQLRELLTGLGYGQVRTLLNSGNAVFESESSDCTEIAAAISSAIQQRLGLVVPVIVLTDAQLGSIVAENPLRLDALEFPRLLAVFAQQPEPLAALEQIRPLLLGQEQLVLGVHAAYLWCASGLLESKAGAALLGRVAQGLTTRNWATVLKLQALAASSARRN